MRTPPPARAVRTPWLENYLRYLRNLIDQAKGGHIQPVYGVGLEPAMLSRAFEMFLS